jgi:hypothetical protein
MKRLFGVLVAVAVVAVAGLAFAQMGGGMGGMGPGMMGGGAPGGTANQGGCHSTDQANAASITEDKAREVAQQYVDTHLPGFTIDKVQPFVGMHGTMYSVELKGPKGEVQVVHVNPWGNVMPGHGSTGRAT